MCAINACVVKHRGHNGSEDSKTRLTITVQSYNPSSSNKDTKLTFMMHESCAIIYNPASPGRHNDRR